MKKTLTEIKYISFFAVILVLILLSFSCEKNLEIGRDIPESQFPSMDAINFNIDDNILNLATLEDYEKLLDYMSKMQEYEYGDFEQFLSFNSFRQEYEMNGKELPLKDPQIFALLNPEGAIIIENHKFTLDFYNKGIDVEKITDHGLKSVNFEFTWNHSVLDILFNNAPYDSDLKSIAFDACGDRTDSNWWPCYTSTIYVELFYSDTPLLYKMKAKISQSPALGRVDINLSSGYTCKKSSWQNRNECASKAYRDGGTASSYSWQIYYSATNRLDGLDSEVVFNATDYSTIPAVVTGDRLAISCDVSDITCD